jgi:hypothetical protein
MEDSRGQNDDSVYQTNSVGGADDDVITFNIIR